MGNGWNQAGLLLRGRGDETVARESDVLEELQSKVAAWTNPLCLHLRFLAVAWHCRMMAGGGSI
jgi:hypothetical protein